ncbi:MAG: glycoside hydrolase [Myxococcales bacterium]
MTRAVFVWHLHQPDYRDPQTGQPLLPWVRLHATRGYNDMAAALEAAPAIRAVVNFAPVLLIQLEAWLSGATDLHESLATRPAESLAQEERALLLRDSFSVDWDLWVLPIPRYAELLDLRGRDLRRLDLLERQSRFTAQDLRDLQVHFLLAWMGFAARREDPFVAEVCRKDRGFSEEEKLGLVAAQRRIGARILPRWKALAARGQVELTCSPLNHPILPLLVDTDSARRAMPSVALPARFAHPEDAREQIVRGLARAETAFGARPEGMWPSEGSVSPEVIDLLGSCGVRWCATDEGVLAKSEVLLGEAPGPGIAAHHRPYVAGSHGNVCMLFRDRELSDLIGFRYAKMAPDVAAADFVRRLSSARGDSLVTIALDGENPWEHYPRSGEAFLSAFYAALSASPIKTVLPRDELRVNPPRSRISRIHSGSWIDANFRIWIGHPEDNAAWTLLAAARDALEQAEMTIGREQIEAARAELFVAEGSDWFWWYGDDFVTDNAPTFDALFRGRIAQAYRALGLPVPGALGNPIIAPQKNPGGAGAVIVQPRRLVQPLIDGYSRNYYEWSGAGQYRPGSNIGGSMFQGRALYEQLLFGFSRSELFLRLDPAPGTQIAGELQVTVARLVGEHREEKSVRVLLAKGGVDLPVVDETGARCGSARTGVLVELSLSLGALGLVPGARIALLVHVVRAEVEIERLPRVGELETVVPDRRFEQAHWQV